jgi:hypothetical protein
MKVINQTQMQDKIAQVKSFLNENVTNETLKNIGLSTAILFVVIVAQLLIHEVVAVVDSIPVFNGVMEIVGLVAFINFTRNNLITGEQRTALVEKVKNTYNDVVV